MNRIKCFFLGHDWGILYYIKSTYHPKQYQSYCKRCDETSKPIIYQRQIPLNDSIDRISLVLEAIDKKLEKEKSTRSKLVKIDKETSINIDYVESIERDKKMILINMSSGRCFQILFNEKDWLKLHELKK